MLPSIVPKNIADLYKKAAERFGNKPAIAIRKNQSPFTFTSYQELFETGKNLGTTLIALGLQSQEHVAIIANNCLEWAFVDCAVQVTGAVDVPCGTNSTEHELKYILQHAETRFIFIENLAVWEKFRSCFPQNTYKLLMSPPANETEIVLHQTFLLQDLISQGAALRQAGNRSVEARIAQIQPQDLFTIIYTSGTTGLAKGVQLTHANAVSQLRNIPLPLRYEDRALSILPIWHSYERIFQMATMSRGITTYYSSLRSITEDFKIVQPTIMCSAPRLLEGIYHKMLAAIRNAPPLQRNLFHLAYEIARRTKTAEFFFHGNLVDLEGRSFLKNTGLALFHCLSWLTCILPHSLLDKTVLKKMRLALGGKFRGTISGGGALQQHVDEFFNFIGIPVLEGYGLTETSPIIAVRTWKKLVIGTVGPVYPETKIRIVDLENGCILYPNPSLPHHGCGYTGEIHVSGPQVMKSYYKDDEATARILQEGWLNTGDIGMMTFNNCLKILGRSKDIIVLLSGENIDPLRIESLLLCSPLIEQCMVVGQNEKYLGALIVPNLEGFSAAGIPMKNPQDVANSPEAIYLLDIEIRKFINQKNGFKPFERITSWRIIPKLFEVGNELTQTFKIKRLIIAEKYADVINEMFHR